MAKYIRVVETCRDTKSRLSEMKKEIFREDIDEQENNLINIYEDMKYQIIDGFGAAFTEAATATLSKISPEKKEEVLQAYFDKEKGIGYNFCRAHIGSCDYCVSDYTYDDTKEDYKLENYSIERDRETIIPIIKEALEVAPDIKLYGSPWSPPAWMKTNESRIEGGKLKKECYEVYAVYMAKFIEEYAKEGITVWGVTVQNEAKAAQPWESCIYTAEEEREFVVKYLGPELEKRGLGDVKIICWDHNKERTVERAKVTYAGEGEKYFYGMGLHWYSGDHFKALEIAHELYPEKKLISTENCTRQDLEAPWKSGERYAHSIIGDMNHWVSAWTDWNLVLDENTGPSHWREKQIAMGEKGVWWYGNSPIMIDTRTEEISYGSAYYYMGHFSKYVMRGAKRIGSSAGNENLEVIAFENPDKTKVVVVLNRTDEEIAYTLHSKNQIADFVIKEHSIQTLLYE